MKVFVGNVLVTVITLMKYIIIIGGIAACILVITSKSNDNQKAQGSKEERRPVEERRDPARFTKNNDILQEPEKIVELKPEGELAKGDFETIKYYNIPITKSQHRKYPINNAYDSFINRAAIKDNDKL